jgi:hypothetical protein
MKDDRIRGMLASEVIHCASRWWDLVARKEIASHLVGAGKLSSRDPDSPNFLPSGIIQGKPWADLDKRECLAVVKAWLDAFRPPEA